MAAMSTSRRVGRAATAGVAVFGILLTHWLAYFIAAPHGHGRSALLESTGHRYFATVVAVLLGCAVVALTRAVTMSGRVSGPFEHDGRARTFAWLFGVQLVGFLVLEGGERLLFAPEASPSHLLHEPVVLTGLVVQVLVAALNTLLVRSFLVLVRAVTSARRPASSGAAPLPSWDSVYRARPIAPCRGAASLRAPPATVS